MKVEEENGIILPQAKECLEPPEARRGQDGSPLEDLEGAWPCQYFDFRLLASRTVN